MKDICAYCGAEALDNRRFCKDCWDLLPGEIHDRVAMTWKQMGPGDHFQNAVEDAIKFLVWVDEDE